jgi:hypothetical protein
MGRVRVSVRSANVIQFERYQGPAGLDRVRERLLQYRRR